MHDSSLSANNIDDDFVFSEDVQNMIHIATIKWTAKYNDRASKRL